MGPPLHEMPDFEGQRLLREEDAGITEFVGKDVAGFSGILKHRYSDFHVCEIDPEGNVIHLRSTELPEDGEKKAEVDPATFPKHNELSEEDRKLVSALSWARILQMAKKYVNDTKPSEDEVVKFNVSEQSKEERTRTHALIKTTFSHLATDTEGPNEEGIRNMNVFYSKNRLRNSRFLNEWPKDRPKYLYFTVFKQDLDSTEVFGKLGSSLQKGRKNITFAGTKDKRGQTTQKACIEYTTPKELKSALSRTRWRFYNQRAAIGDYEYRDTRLKLGDLQGNRFGIVLRNVKAEKKEDVEAAMKNLKEHGFINYYGMQRFGTSTVRTSDIGLAIIREDFKLAVELILKPRPFDNPQVAQLRKVWWKWRDAELALKVLGRHKYDSQVESCLLEGLNFSHANDFVNALNRIPKFQRLMYVHAYQSYIWNQAVSERVSKHGLKVLVGDLFTDVPEEKRVSAQDVNVSTVGKDETETGGVVISNKLDQQFKVKEVTEENIEGVTIYDVVMPLPGYRVKYPNNDIKDIYVSLLEKDGLTLGSFENSVREYTLGGDYRSLISRAKDVTWELINYDDANETLLLSDFDRVVQKKPELPRSPESGRYLGMVVNLSLATCNYATMALREALKIDTGKEKMSELTRQYVEEYKKEKGEKSKSEEDAKEEDAKEGEDTENGEAAQEEKESVDATKSAEDVAAANEDSKDDSSSAVVAEEKGEPAEKRAKTD